MATGGVKNHRHLPLLKHALRNTLSLTHSAAAYAASSAVSPSIQLRLGHTLDTLLTKTLVTLGSTASISFGIWHFFVPRKWNWYSYMDASATELIAAVRAINVFFSLSLVLFGLMNLLMAYGQNANRYSVLVVLGATCALWAARVVMQLTYPQGSMNPALQHGMLLVFVLVLGCYSASLVMVLLDKNPG